MKFGLEGIKRLLNFLGNPENKFISIHIAGTNGKGSTASMIASILTAEGYRTGLFTSPHLINFEERIRINGKPIQKNILADLVSLIKDDVLKNKNTFFEATTAIAFKYFADSKIDIAIIETGLGGRLDATNVIKPLVSVITSIGLEHTQILGNSIKKIAYEKAGIIKKNTPCVIGILPKEANHIIKNICKNKSVILETIQADQFEIKKSFLHGFIMNYKSTDNHLVNINVSLPGKFQAINASISIKTIEVLNKHNLLRIKLSSIYKGLKNIQKYAGLQARLSVIRKKPLVIVDVAHNPDAMLALREAIINLNIREVNVLIGLMKDKNHKKIISILKPITKRAFVVKPLTTRAIDPKKMISDFKKYAITVNEYNNVVNGYKDALRYSNRTPLLITGSHFVVGEILAHLNRKEYLTINQ